MKKLILFLTLTLVTLGAMAGPTPPQRPNSEQVRELKEFKMKYLAQEMELKEEQKERFASLYDKMMTEKRRLFSKVHEMERKIRANKNASDEDYAQLSTAMNEARAKELEIDRRYDAEFAKFLTKKQMYQFKEAEGKFRDKMREMCAPNKKHKTRDKKSGKNK